MDESSEDQSPERNDSSFGYDPELGQEEAAAHAVNVVTNRSEIHEGATIGNYRLLQEIGTGGFGTVWMAEQKEPISRMVALKVIKAGMDTKEVLARFEAERQALAMMDHPNIAKVLDAGATDSGRPYFAMELVKGIPITEYCDEAKLDTTNRLVLFSDVCSAIQHAHQKGIIHRDIKPSNVMVTLYADKPVVKVIDFGIAKATHGRLTDQTLFTRFEQFIGTPVYMSPEQAALSAVDIDTRSDIYALGVLLYELLTGKPPFDTETLVSAGYDEMRRIIREVEPPKPSSRLLTVQGEERTTLAKAHRIAPDKLSRLVASDLDWIVMKAIEKDRTRRYETANAFAVDIENFLKDEPVSARRPSAAYRTRKFVKRNRVAVIAGTAFAALVLVGISSTLWFAIGERQQRKVAESMEQEANERGNEAKSYARLAKKSNERTIATLNNLLFQQAEDYLEGDELGFGIAYLCRIIRNDPLNGLAAERLINLLWQREFPMVLRYPLAHSAKVESAQLSPDGKQVVTASGKTVIIWDSTTGQALGSPIHQIQKISSVQFSPDGTLIMTNDSDSTVRIWNVATRQLVGSPMHHGSISELRFSPDGSLVAVGTTDTVRIWDTARGQLVCDPMVHSEWVDSVEFSPDGSRVLTYSNVTYRNGTARVWDVSKGQMQGQPMQHDKEITSARFSPDGLRVVTTSNNKARIWDAKTGQQVGSPLDHRVELVQAAQFTNDGLGLLTAGYHSIFLWDAVSSRLLSRWNDTGSVLINVDFSPDGMRALASLPGGQVQMYNPMTGKKVGDPILCQKNNVPSAHFSSDGLKVVTVSGKNVKVWDVVKKLEIYQTLPQKEAVYKVFFSADGKRIITAESGPVDPDRDWTDRLWEAKIGATVIRLLEDWTTRLWDAETGRAIGKPMHHDESIVSARFSLDGSRIVTASRDDTARIWDGTTGEPVGKPIRHLKHLHTARFSPDGTKVVTASWDKTARIWDAATGKSLGKPLRHEGVVSSARFSPDGLWVVTASHDNTVRLWDAVTGQPLGEPMLHEDEVCSADFSPDGSQILSASKDHTARIWDAVTCELVGEPMIHYDEVRYARFSPDGSRVVTAMENHQAQVWNVATLHPVGSPMPHHEEILNAHFGPDGSRVVTTSRDGNARMWDASTGLPLSDPIYHGAGAEFSPCATRLVTVTQDHTARIWKIPPAQIPVPGWVADFFEALGGRRLSDSGVIEPVPPEEILKIRQRVLASEDLNSYTLAAKRLFAEQDK